MYIRREEESDNCAVDNARDPCRRHRKRFGEHYEREEEERRMLECLGNGRERRIAVGGYNDSDE